jgi:hypothetical protein
MLRLARLCLVGLGLVLPGLAHAAGEIPPAGTWKVLLPTEDGRMQPVVLLQLNREGDRWTGKVLAAAEGLHAGVDGVRVTDNALRCTLKLETSALHLECALPPKKDGKLTGCVLRAGNPSPAELEPTTAASLDEFELSKESLARQAVGYDAVRAALTLLSLAGEKKAKPDEVRGWAARAVQGAEPYGAWQRAVVLAVAEILTQQAGYEEVALTYARRAERLLGPGDGPARQQRVLKALAAALAKSGKSGEAREVEARLGKLDFGIKVAPPAGRKGDGRRVVLVELFTGAQCPPCVAADLAFDALGQTFGPAEVVRLQYHLHVPGPDPLANPDSEARVQYYGNSVPGTPAVLFNGRPEAAGGGGRENGQEKYDEYLAAVRPLLGGPAPATLKATAQRQGVKVQVRVEGSAGKEAGDRLRLRLALVEGQVDYTGSNGLPAHGRVVRTFLGGAEGERLAAGTPFEKTFTADLDQLRKDLRDYLDKAAEETPFPNKDRPLEFKDLRVVAFVQNDATREVLQAVEVEVPKEAK